MIISANTKIATLLKHNADALEAIISLTPKFEKLRNPLLRKLMAGRTSIGMASKISGCSVEDFFTKLAPLGFEIDMVNSPVNEVKPHLPAFFNSLKPDQIQELDVRPVIEAGEDPLSLIVKTVKSIKQGDALKIINSFEPTPLLSLLKKQGFDSYVDVIDENLVETYFYRAGENIVEINKEIDIEVGWDNYMEKYTGHLETVDVRDLPMPQPMMTILGAIENLPDDKALFVYHKKIPVFLLPELKEKGFDFRIKEISENQVHLLIFKE
ncbi:MAG: DUF2249 domain-containing protein [Ginsengibacter sp.]|jgi:hypothetical protein